MTRFIVLSLTLIVLVIGCSNNATSDTITDLVGQQEEVTMENIEELLAEHHGYSHIFLSDEELLQIERIW